MLNGFMTISDYSKVWLNEYHVHEVERTTFVGYGYEIKKIDFCDWFAALRMEEIKPRDINNFMMFLTDYAYAVKDGKPIYYAHSALLKTLNVLRALFRFAILNGDTSENPTASVKAPRKEKAKGTTREFSYFQKEDCRRIEDTCFNVRRFHTQNGLAVIFLLETGLRIGELLALTVEDIDFQKRRIRVNKQYSRVTNTHDVELKQYTKTANGVRWVPLTRTAERVVQELDRETGLLFHSREDSRKPINQRALGRFLQNLKEYLGIEEEGSLHMLRHTFASNCLYMQLSDGSYLPVKMLSSWLGHGGIEITLNVYAKIISERENDYSVLLDDIY